MTFLNPLLLLGLVAAAVPVLLHLFQRRRPREVVFSNVALLRDIRATTVRRVRIQEWLLLALRVLALAALALGFARPVMEGAWADAGSAPVSVGLVVDNSASTAQRSGSGTALAALRADGERLAATLRPGDEVFLVTTAGSMAGLASVTPLRTADALLAALDSLRPRAGGVALTTALDRAAALLDGARHRQRLLVALTDAQSATLVDSGAARVAFDGPLTVVAPPSTAGANAVVVDVRLAPSARVEAGQPLDVDVSVARVGGAGPLAVRLVEVGAGGRRVAVAQGSASASDGGAPVRVRLRTTLRGRGDVAFEAELTPPPGDALAADDRRAFVVRVPGLRRVLVVRGTPSRALDAVLAPGLVDGAPAFDADDASAASLVTARLEDYAAVIVSGVSDLPPASADALARYVRAGGGLVVFAADRPDGLGALLARLGAGGIGAPVDVPEGTVLSRVDASHPVFAGVFQPSPGRRVEPERVAVRRVAPLRGGVPLATLSNGAALVSETRVGAGRVLAIAVAPETAWSDLPTSGLFAPLVLRGLAAVTASGGAGETAVAGRGPSLRIAGTFEAPLALDGPVGAPRARRTVPPQRASVGAVLVEPDVAEAGLYDVRTTAGGADPSRDSAVARVALTEDPRESDLRRLSAGALADTLRRATGLEVRVAEGVGTWRETKMSGPPPGRDLWNVLFGVALALLALESVLGRRWRTASRGA